ncbi:MAG TPA: glycosyltransferase [Usitatibacter sp.]|nr:glycosyltransferase [Usitatibacter sp.]
MIDVIVPVYGGLAQTRTCLESVLAAPRSVPFELVVVEDASPEPAIREFVAGLAREGRAHVVHHPSNQGFVRSVNEGMSIHRDRDVVLLNSDTEVANDWLFRLAAAASSAARVATVTPFSNNATICSYPFWGWEGGLPGSLGLAALDTLAAKANAGVRIDLPTAVGFCMYIPRRALDALGAFDAERYGRGYGEENDFSMRAAKAGWRNLLAADVFIFHEGSVSFSGDRHALQEAAARNLIEAHPEYTAAVHQFLVADTVAPLREAIDRARLDSGAVEGHAVISERSRERARILAEMREMQRRTAGSHS